MFDPLSVVIAGSLGVSITAMFGIGVAYFMQKIDKKKYEYRPKYDTFEA